MQGNINGRYPAGLLHERYPVGIGNGGGLPGPGPFANSAPSIDTNFHHGGSVPVHEALQNLLLRLRGNERNPVGLIHERAQAGIGGGKNPLSDLLMALGS